MTTRREVELTAAYQRQVLALARLGGDHARAEYAALGSWDRADVPRFERAVRPFLAPLDAEAVAVTDAYLSELTGEAVALVPPAADPVPLDGPFLRQWRMLKSVPFEDARVAGMKQAFAAGHDSVVVTSRRAAGSAPRSLVVGWRRVPGPSACDWCRLVATQRYHTAESATFGHKRCDCTLAPITGKSDPGRVVNSGELSKLRKAGTVDRLSRARQARRLAVRAENAAARAAAELDPVRRGVLIAEAREWETRAATELDKLLRAA